jgi:hypothetical protein
MTMDRTLPPPASVGTYIEREGGGVRGGGGGGGGGRRGGGGGGGGEVMRDKLSLSQARRQKSLH